MRTWLAISAVILAFALTLAGLVAGTARPAWADGAAFDEAYARGTDAFRLFKYEEAWEHFTKAQKLGPKKPGPYRWLGLVAKEQKRWRECIENLTTAMRLNPESSHSQQMRVDHEVCRKQLGLAALTEPIPPKQGAIAVVSNVEGAAVVVDAIKKGATPLAPFPVNAGKRWVRVEREGYLTHDLDLEVVEGIVNDVEVLLEKDPDAVVADDRLGVEGGSTAEVQVGWLALATNVGPLAMIRLDGKQVTPGKGGRIEVDPGVHVVEIEAEGHEPWRRRVVAYKGQKRAVTAELKKTEARRRERRNAFLALGAAAAFGASGAAFGLLENRAFDEATQAALLERGREGGALPAELPEAQVRTRAEIDEISSRGKTYGLIANLSYAVAATSLGVSLYYFIQERSAERKGYELPMAIVPTSGPDGARGAQVVYTRELGL